MQKLSLKQYAALLYETVGEYDFPTVTYNFAKDPCYTLKKDWASPHKKGKLPCHDCMCAVEEYIGGLLRSQEVSEVRDGLSNVLYWGHARAGYRDYRVRTFREDPDTELEGKPLQEFVQLTKEFELTKELERRSKDSEVLPGSELLHKIKELGIPQFKSGIPFVSKILMFLDPVNYPVLDTKIAKAYAKKRSFSPLEHLIFTKSSIPIDNEKNKDAYDQWACWCREIAGMVNKSPESPCNRFRAVDVERALFTLISSKETDKIRARALLAGPEGWTFDHRNCKS